jgi:hypothetical protein
MVMKTARTSRLAERCDETARTLRRWAQRERKRKRERERERWDAETLRRETLDRENAGTLGR